MDNPDPQLVWVPCLKDTHPESAKKYDNPHIEPLLGKPITASTERFNIAKNEVRGYTLDHTVQIYGRHNWLKDGSKPNQAALALTDWELPFDWRGNILIMSNAGLVNDRVKPAEIIVRDLTIPIKSIGGEVVPFKDFRDISMTDFRIAVDYLSTFGMGIARGNEHEIFEHVTFHTLDGNVSELQKKFAEDMALEEAEAKRKNVKGVMIRCEGDNALNLDETGRWDRYAEINVSRDHVIWKEPPSSPSKMMGLPLLLHKLPENPAWDKTDHTRFDNQPATFLNLTVDPKNEDMWGFAPPEWQSQVGSVLLVRQDGKDISREQVWALAEYMQFRVSDSFEDAMQSGEERQMRAAVLKMLNWKRFETWLENFKVEMTAADYKSWTDVKSPFGRE